MIDSISHDSSLRRNNPGIFLSIAPAIAYDYRDP